MPFPDSERVIYGRNPLEIVICQLRFPPILRIDAALPSDFQDQIREQYPEFEEVSGLTLGPEIPKQLAPLLGASLPGGPKAYHFGSADGKWKCVLTRDFLALETSDYQRWEDFRGRLVELESTLVDVYEPASYSRIGLRYRDVIRPDTLELEPNWARLLQSHILGELADPVVSTEIVGISRTVLVRLPRDGCQVRIRHGLSADDSPSAYSIDADFFREARTEINDAKSILDDFHRTAGRLFRWCITEELHQAMQPRPPA